MRANIPFIPNKAYHNAYISPFPFGAAAFALSFGSVYGIRSSTGGIAARSRTGMDARRGGSIKEMKAMT